jgi:predicted nuclease of restriction endonuclease-like (RecB) superfamily
VAVKINTYKNWFAEVKTNIQQVRYQSSMQVNAQLLYLYAYIGKQILLKQKQEGWGAKIIDKFSTDLQKTFPDMRGFSVRNIKYMRQFAEFYPNFLIVQEPPAQIEIVASKNKKSITQEPLAQFKKSKRQIVQEPLAQMKNSKLVIVQEPLAQFKINFENLENKDLAGISWYHHILLMTKIANDIERNWYIKKTIENNWSSTILVHQIESGLYERQALSKKQTNFHRTLPKEQGELALQILKDPYEFGLTTLTEITKERDLEKLLVEHISMFLMELGSGFAYMGRQFKIPTPRKIYSIDLLFYHVHLHCYIVFELKITNFEMQHGSQINGYVTLIDRFLKKENDKPTIGIVLCKEKDDFEVELSLDGLQKPIAVTAYNLKKLLSKELIKELKRFNKAVLQPAEKAVSIKNKNRKAK